MEPTGQDKKQSKQTNKKTQVLLHLKFFYLCLGGAGERRGVDLNQKKGMILALALPFKSYLEGLAGTQAIRRLLWEGICYGWWMSLGGLCVVRWRQKEIFLTYRAEEQLHLARPTWGSSKVIIKAICKTLGCPGPWGELGDPINMPAEHTIAGVWKNFANFTVRVTGPSPYLPGQLP